MPHCVLIRPLITDLLSSELNKPSIIDPAKFLTLIHAATLYTAHQRPLAVPLKLRHGPLRNRGPQFENHWAMQKVRNKFVAIAKIRRQLTKMSVEMKCFMGKASWTWQQDGTKAHTARETVHWLRQNVPDFIEPN